MKKIKTVNSVSASGRDFSAAKGLTLSENHRLLNVKT
ncbi:MAG: hypothetical protein RL011_1363 [Pseudomonadota bacterium]|jgi:hypothetical protein